MFKIGDYVRFIDEKREGYITKIIDDLTVGVTDTDGFEIPVAKSNLTYVHGHHSNADTANNAMPATQVDEKFVEDGIYLAVAEDNKASVVANFTLVNRTSYQLLLSLKTEKGGIYKGEFAGVVQPKSSVQVYTANLGDLDNWPNFTFQALFFTTGNVKPTTPLQLNKRFKSKDFSGAKNQIAEINKYGWLIRLDEPALVIDAQKLKESFFNVKEEKPKVAKPAQEIDLHIEKLRDDHHFLSQSEILNEQLSAFKKTLDAAIVHQMPSIVFIHGVGNGTLRDQIHKTISKHPQVRTFMDAKKEKFGYGATEVIFKV
ncbi:Smr/MutS family protein [Pedobacter ureilyticus]|uniref:Smr/MutS family protein n=1 Tax=Pedobacter ureilyticus TaxID=1393051 RepID=A0ABW9J7I1_9SPHI|nr:Smr/MutS family protein [Pedobacter helvus]